MRKLSFPYIKDDSKSNSIDTTTPAGVAPPSHQDSSARTSKDSSSSRHSNDDQGNLHFCTENFYQNEEIEDDDEGNDYLIAHAMYDYEV